MPHRCFGSRRRDDHRQWWQGGPSDGAGSEAAEAGHGSGVRGSDGGTVADGQSKADRRASRMPVSESAGPGEHKNTSKYTEKTVYKNKIKNIFL